MERKYFNQLWVDWVLQTTQKFCVLKSLRLEEEWLILNDTNFCSSGVIMR